MNHSPEFQSQPDKSVAEAHQRELEACYARVFLGDDDGRRVLADLRAKFGLQRLCFVKSGGDRYDYLSAAIRDGERHVMLEIETAVTRGGKSISPT